MNFRGQLEQYASTQNKNVETTQSNVEHFFRFLSSIKHTACIGSPITRKHTRREK